MGTFDFKSANNRHALKNALKNLKNSRNVQK